MYHPLTVPSVILCPCPLILGILGPGGGGGEYHTSQYSRRSGLAGGLGVVCAFVLPVSLGIRFWAVGLESTCKGSALSPRREKMTATQ